MQLAGQIGTSGASGLTPAPCTGGSAEVMCNVEKGGHSITDIRLQNNLTGVIPASFANFTELTNLRLDGNQLSGSIPQLARPNETADAAVELQPLHGKGTTTDV